MDSELFSKVLVLDQNPECYGVIKAFCESHNLLGLKVQEERMMSVLQSYIDLGGIMLSESCAGLDEPDGGLARAIHKMRPELPIFLRLKREESAPPIPPSDLKLFNATYRIDDINVLHEAVVASIFSQDYPNALVRGIIELSLHILTSQFPSMNVEVEKPYLVRDRLISGEVTSLIPLESNWCRGYMMLQAKESALRELVPGKSGDFRLLNNMLGELTNLTWGAFKSRYINQAPSTPYTSQVPTIVNHEQRYITFGSDDPLLCFNYLLSAKDGGPPVTLQQRFIFNLNWSPEDFRENETSVDDFFKSGELELF